MSELPRRTPGEAGAAEQRLEWWIRRHAISVRAIAPVKAIGRARVNGSRAVPAVQPLDVRRPREDPGAAFH